MDDVDECIKIKKMFSVCSIATLVIYIEICPSIPPGGVGGHRNVLIDTKLQ